MRLPIFTDLEVAAKDVRLCVCARFRRRQQQPLSANDDCLGGRFLAVVVPAAGSLVSVRDANIVARARLLQPAHTVSFSLKVCTSCCCRRRRTKTSNYLNRRRDSTTKTTTTRGGGGDPISLLKNFRPPKPIFIASFRLWRFPLVGFIIPSALPAGLCLHYFAADLMLLLLLPLLAGSPPTGAPPSGGPFIFVRFIAAWLAY